MNKKLCAALTALLLLTGCTSGSISMTAEQESIVQVTIKNGQKDSSESISSIRVTEDDLVIISPTFDKGEVNVVLKDAAGNIGLSEMVSGRALSEYEVTPGTYTVTVTMLSRTNGTMSILVKNRMEFEAENESLSEALESMETEKPN